MLPEMYVARALQRIQGDGIKQYIRGRNIRNEASTGATQLCQAKW
jgi:hypothetical protein